MNAYHDIPLRRARDQMINLLFQHAPPASALKGADFKPDVQFISNLLRDLPVGFQAKVPDGQRSLFYILGGQPEVQYVLCDEEGTPLKEGQKEITGDYSKMTVESDKLFHELRSVKFLPEGILSEGSLPEIEDKEAVIEFIKTWRSVVAFSTPVIDKDQTFRILGRKNIETSVANEFDKVEEYLHQAIFLRVGIDTTIPVRFVPRSDSESISEKGDIITVDYKQPETEKKPLRIQISQSQEGIYYQLFERTSDGKKERSDAVIGGSQGTAGDMNLVIDVKGEFEDDMEFFVRAYRTPAEIESKDLLLAGDLQQTLLVMVRPNKAIQITVDSKTVPYNDKAKVTLKGIQASVKYQLFSRQLSLSEYQPDGTLEIKDAGSIVDLVALGNAKSGKQAGSITFDSGALQEDSVIVVMAAKKEPADSKPLRLDTVSVVLVQPDPGPVVKVIEDTIAPDTEGMINVSNTQKNVKYQLRINTKAVKEPGYHFAERAIAAKKQRREFGMRIGVDFKIGNPDDTAEVLFADKSLLLPTGPLSKTTTFKVVAIKSYTGLETELPDSVKITVKEPV